MVYHLLIQHIVILIDNGCHACFTDVGTHIYDGDIFACLQNQYSADLTYFMPVDRSPIRLDLVEHLQQTVYQNQEKEH